MSFTRLIITWCIRNWVAYTISCSAHEDRFSTPTLSIHTNTQVDLLLLMFTKKLPATAEEVQVIRFTGAVSLGHTVCPAWTAAAAACFELQPASVYI